MFIDLGLGCDIHPSIVSRIAPKLEIRTGQ